jgi:hypothetical protein
MLMANSNNKSEINASHKEDQIIIQIKRPGEKLEMSTIKKILKDTGIKLDQSYGPYLVNPKEGRFVVRGIADPKAEEKALKIKGVTIFHDLPINTDSMIGTDSYRDAEQTE